MSLVAAHGPLGPDRLGWFSPPVPDPVVYIEPLPRRVQAVVNGEVVIDTERALLVHRAGSALSYAFPAADICGFASEPVPEAAGFVSVAWDAVDEWVEEGRQLVNYPPNPYHRVDCRPTKRKLRIEVGGVVLVETDDTVILFETAIAPRLYVDKAFVRMDLLQPSPTTSYCNYKGFASYWSVVTSEGVIDDVAWSYDDPLPESSLIAQHLSFDETLVDVTAELPIGSSAPEVGA